MFDQQPSEPRAVDDRYIGGCLLRTMLVESMMKNRDVNTRRGPLSSQLGKKRRAECA
jgi:hypothetical protein